MLTRTQEGKWDEAKVRDLLPRVTVRVGHRTVVGMVTGRRNEFATVSILAGEWGWSQANYSWSAIAHSLSAGKPLIW